MGSGVDAEALTVTTEVPVKLGFKERALENFTQVWEQAVGIICLLCFSSRFLWQLLSSQAVSCVEY